MDRFSSLRVFIRVVERGSFTHVGRELGIGQPAVSKQIAALEQHLGTQLLSRTSRGLQPTAAGLDLYETAIRILGDLDEAEIRIGQKNIRPSGVVRLATPPAFGRMFIIPRLPAFFEKFPDITLDISVAERRVDLIIDGIDIALRVGTLADSTLITRKIGDLHMGILAAPAYLRKFGTPRIPADLGSHNLVAGQTRGATQPWRFNGPDGPILMQPEGNIRSNDIEDQRAAVLMGLGIGYAGLAMFSADVKAGTVVPILEEFAAEASPIHVICANGRRMPQRFRVVIDFLAEICAEEPGLRASP